MKVLAFDPGFGRLGIAVINRSGGHDTLEHSVCFETSTNDPHYVRLATIDNHVKDLCQKFKPDSLALETLFFNKNVKTALKVAEVRGLLLARAAKANLTLSELGPAEIKLAVTGNGRCSKADIKKMIKLLFPNETNGTRHDDEYDAIAVGVAGLAKMGSPLSRLQNL